jgi:hypothetical protein
LHNEELHELHCPDEVSVVIISRIMRQERHVASMDEKKTRIDFWCENQRYEGIKGAIKEEEERRLNCFEAG